MAGTYSFYDKRQGLMTFPIRSSHSCMTAAKLPVDCAACREEHEILRKHNESKKGNKKSN